MQPIPRNKQLQVKRTLEKSSHRFQFTNDLFTSNSQADIRLESQDALLNLIASRLEQLAEQVQLMSQRLNSGDVDPPDAITVEQAAKLLGRRPFTVREWCRLGRIEAHRATARGPYSEWRIPMAAVKNYQAFGLLPITRRAK